MPTFENPQQHPHIQDEKRRLAEQEEPGETDDLDEFERETAELADIFGDTGPGEFEAHESEADDLFGDLFGEVVYSYTRAQALADGNLIDVASLAPDSAALQAALKPFKFPLAATPAALGYLGRAFPELEPAAAVAEVLWVAAMLARGNNCDRLLAHRNAEDELWLHIGPGDTPEPVMTLMLPEDA